MLRDTRHFFFFLVGLNHDTVSDKNKNMSDITTNTTNTTNPIDHAIDHDQDPADEISRSRGREEAAHEGRKGEDEGEGEGESERHLDRPDGGIRRIRRRRLRLGPRFGRQPERVHQRRRRIQRG